MTHMNKCDLSVFPTMSRRHCALARASGGLHVLKEDQIWEAAEQVWQTLPNSKIASAYAHAYCIAGEVVRQKGDNDFLGEKSELSFGVRRQFFNRIRVEKKRWSELTSIHSTEGTKDTNPTGGRCDGDRRRCG